MTLLYKTIFICILIGTPLIGHNQISKPGVIKLTADNSGKTLAIVKGQRFTLVLPDHVDGGYRFDGPQYDGHILRMLKQVEIHPGNNNRPGEAGRDTWQFVGIKKGTSNLKITASRPWAKADIIIVYSSIVVVK